MKKAFFILLIAVSLTAAVSAQDIVLPPPAGKSGVDLIGAIANRRVSKTFVKKEIPAADLSTILWAGLGLRRADAVSSATKAGRNISFSGDAAYINIYLLTEKGSWKYLADKNSLQFINGIDVRSKVSSDISIYPQIATRKVYVIDGDGLNEEGQNAILKTLEEPPSYAVFLITVQDASKLLPTVMSRSVTVALSPNTEEEVLSILTSRLGVPAKDAVFYARYANGIPGHAINLAQSQWFSGLREDVAGLIFSIPDAGKASILTSAYSFFETEKDHCDEILLIIELIFRDMAFLTSDGGAVNLLNDDKRDKMKSVISRHKLSVSNIRRANDAVTRASRSLLANCSYESTVCQMLLSIQKELSNA